ncbi:MAG: nucleotidyl transferase AbiEii/AbiGii toxin family protein [Candidatus Thermoplasmatota archaeon]|nr:nucleotidyl transferase AbiEii/AbiGii toxin family protein [Euryarchaeota archaeon]MBU4031178.1 nucleotidyl transferase AbiEii/AbiGii toxin family protein [Candidatus Thermoplasmatota archaeon]MBU4071518.1 nucleotidyl transferase AbiEii/AbiGii toxin family protein [Candidatus Thermoplasmatota archaeon]MBU4144715.1 nucleotidyl transferase AbiEii/AbiGii toxin family protein [Candidatus Thermoplasmatota archaeon]MBU4592694.1 nucleotidyl transferase AbiEii/AbiGii toxin family protein [Candidatus
MITPDDIKRIAREKEVDPTTIERDYVQNWFLKSLYSNSDYLLFKGGTSIRKAFVQDYRFSDDLDFTLSKEVSQEEITELINKSKTFVHDEIGVTFEDDTPFKDVESGWKVKLHYTSRVTGGPIKLIMDITHSHLEKVITDFELHSMYHNYPDQCAVELKTYSLKEITTEKLRALCQRGWPRDLYDVYNLWPQVEKDIIQEIFIEKCKFKGFEPTLKSYDNNEESLRSAWAKSLDHQLKNIPDFDMVFQDVRKILKEELNVK